MKCNTESCVEVLKIVLSVLVNDDKEEGGIHMCWLKTNPTPSTFTTLIRWQSLKATTQDHAANCLAWLYQLWTLCQSWHLNTSIVVAVVIVNILFHIKWKKLNNTKKHIKIVIEVKANVKVLGHKTGLNMNWFTRLFNPKHFPPVYKGISTMLRFTV